MLTLKTDKECKYIVKNVLSACRDISKLTKAGYNFLYLAQGFIAHYNRAGFMDYYREPGSLERDILANARANQWYNFSATDKDGAYYHQKRDIYNAILSGLMSAL